MAEFRKNLPIKDIKSNYINQEIFSFLDKKLLLKLIINNKYLQNKLGISIREYAGTAGKYKIAEKNGIGKIYDLETDKLIFEGEYLNGKKNGKGKEYFFDGTLNFEGEYLNGEKNGKGKEYSYGRLIFEGEFLNNKRHGKGKEYSYGRLIFEGEFLNNERHGKGKEYNYSGLIFEGEYLNGQKWTGKGKEYFINRTGGQQNKI